MKIYILSPQPPITPDHLKKLGELGTVIIDKNPKPFDQIEGVTQDKEENIFAVDPDFCDWNIKNEEVAKILNLKAICLQSTSFSWADGAFLKSREVALVNNPGFSTEAVAEWMIMVALNLARKTPLLVKEGWNEDCGKYLGIELKGKVAGILGLGRIGKRVAELCQGMGMKVVYWSKNSRDDRFQYSELTDVVKKADFLFPTWAKNEETSKLLTAELINNLKPSAVFVGIHIVQDTYNHELILKMAEEGRIFGYGFEGKAGEFTNHKGNVWAGPTLAWVTDASLQRNEQGWVKNILNAAKGEFPNRVN